MEHGEDAGEAYANGPDDAEGDAERERLEVCSRMTHAGLVMPHVAKLMSAWGRA